MKIEKLYRSNTLSGEVNEESRSMEISFSSEMPVERWFGKETLSHAKEAMEMARLADGAPLLWNHNTDDIIGVVEGAEVRSDKRGYAKIRFAKTARGDEMLGMVRDGIIKNVSFGYQIKEMEQANKGAKNAEPEFVVTRFEPYEISLVSVPADPTVGVGRAEDGEKREVVITNKQPEKTEGVLKMDKPEITVSETEIRNKAIEAERARVTAISSLGEKHGMGELARELISGGKSVDEARSAILERMGAKQKPISENDAKIGLTEKQIKEFSFARMLHALANPTDRKAQEEAKFEREVSEAHAAKTGKAARGMFVPHDVLSFKRDLNVTTATAGGNTVATELLASSFIDLLRNKSVVTQAGATMMSGLQGFVNIPKQTGAAQAYWIAESGAPTESQQTVGQISLSPKTVGAFTDYSRRLLIQSSIDVEQFIRNDLASIIALEIDRVAHYGTGLSNQPQGLRPKLAGGSNEVNFAAATPTFAELVNMESLVNAQNADIGSMNYICNSNMYGALKTALKVAGYPVYILEDGQVNGYPVIRSNQIAAGDVFFGVYSQLMLAMWSGLDIMVDPYTGSTSGTVRIVALQDVDVQTRYNEAFVRGADVP